MRKRMKFILIGIAGCVVVGLSGVMLSSLFYDKSNPRNRPNSYFTEVSVEVNKPVHDVYLFVKYRKADMYNKLTSMHSQFKIVNADGLVEGAEIECIKGDDEDIVHHRYVVKQDREDVLIQYESTPSTIYDKETNKRIGECNTYVYYDFIKLDNNKTMLRQTIVIDMLNPFYKVIGDIVGRLSGSRETWARQFQEELEVLKGYIEK